MTTAKYIRMCRLYVAIMDSREPAEKETLEEFEGLYNAATQEERLEFAGDVRRYAEERRKDRLGRGT